MAVSRRRALLLGGALAVVILVLLTRGALLPGSHRVRPDPEPEGPVEQIGELPGLPDDRDPEEEPTAAEKDGAWGLTVRDHDGTPIEKARVFRMDGKGQGVLTDPDGFAPVFVKQGESTVKVVIDGDFPRATFDLDRPHGEYFLPRYRPLLLRIIDGVTGRILRGGRLHQIAANQPPKQLIEGPEGHILDRAPARAGIARQMKFSVAPPDGYVHINGWAYVLTTVSIFSDRLRGEIAVWPELNLTVRVSEEDGAPAPGARVAGVWMGMKRIPILSHPSSAAGEIPVKGVAALRDEWITVRVAGTHERSVSASARIPGFHEPLVIEARLPRPVIEEIEDGRPFDTSIGIGGGAGGAFGRRGLRRNPLIPNGGVEILVKRRNGEPAPHTEVRVRHKGWWKELRTDASGVLRIEDMVPRDYLVEVLEPGFTPQPPRTVPVGSGTTTSIEIREETGRTATILVLDDKGRPVPSAHVSVKTRSGRNLLALDEDGEQWVTPMTDVDGRILLTFLPPFPVRVTVSQGTREAKGTLAPGEFLELRLVAR